MHRIDTPGATLDGKFQYENPGAGTEATELSPDWLTAIQEEIVGVIEAAGIVLNKNDNTQFITAIKALAAIGPTVAIATETTLDVTQGLIFLNPAEGETLLIHLPIYANVSAAKRYRFKNVGSGVARLDAVDNKTIDGIAYIDLNPGDRAEIIKYNNNWETI